MSHAMDSDNRWRRLCYLMGRFPKHCRVRTTFRYARLAPKARLRGGKVVGYSRDARCLIIKFDGLKSKRALYYEHISRVREAKA